MKENFISDSYWSFEDVPVIITLNFITVEGFHEERTLQKTWIALYMIRFTRLKLCRLLQHTTLAQNNVLLPLFGY